MKTTRTRIPRAGLAMALAGLIVASAATTSACQRGEELIIGFCGGLVGKTADLGVPARDAVTMAVEQRNARGGVAGRPVRLLVANDRQSPEEALRADQRLIDAGAVAIIGHMTSDLTTAALPLINQRRVVMISPTAAASTLAGRDDYLFRLYQGNRGETEAVAHYTARVAGVRRVVVAVEWINRQYTFDWADHFDEAFVGHGGQKTIRRVFSANPPPDYRIIIKEIMDQKPQAVAIAADAADAAMLCQQLRKHGFVGMIILAGGAMTPLLTQHGGMAVEGVVAAMPHVDDANDVKRRAFEESFVARFGYEPNFAARRAFDAAQLLFAAAEEAARRGVGLKEALDGVRRLEGLQGPIELDRYGDASGQFWIATIHEGKPRVIRRD